MFAASSRADDGFTLLELLVVMAVVGIVLVLVSPSLPQALSAVKLKTATRELATAVRAAAAEAVFHHRDVAFSLDVESGHYTVGSATRGRTVDPDLELKLLTAESEKVSETQGRIRFFPDGSSTGGQVTLANETGQYEIAVDWLTGKVAIVD